MMKKILYVLLIGGVCMGLFRCENLNVLLGRVPKKQQQALLNHLEQKYNEKFIIKEIHSSAGDAGYYRIVKVYPEGKEEEEFGVSVEYGGKFIDDYVLNLWQKRMLPVYEEWVQSEIPSAKIGIDITCNFSKELEYNPDESFQKLVNNSEESIFFEINIMLNEDLLKDKDEILEKLVKLSENEPVTGYMFRDYNIGFYNRDAFEHVKSGELKYIPYSLKPYSDGTIDESDADFVAVTSCTLSNDPKPKWGCREQLNDKFTVKENTYE